MSFHDLPPDWATRPLTEPRLVADVLDLVISIKDRYRRSLALLLCDDQDRLVQPIVIGELPDQPDERDLLRPFETVRRHVDDWASLVVAIGRCGGLSVTPSDRAWAEAARSFCADEIRLLGVHVVTLDGSRPIDRLSSVA